MHNNDDIKILVQNKHSNSNIGNILITNYKDVELNNHKLLHNTVIF